MRPLLLLSILSCYCGKFASFTQPPPDQAGPKGPFHWEASPEPVLSWGDWDSGDVLNPSVVKFNGEYWNYYSGYDGHTWSTGIATSSDGIHWIKRGKIRGPDAGNGSALVVGGKILYWYQTGSPVQIALDRKIVLKTGPRGSWDENRRRRPICHRTQWGIVHVLPGHGSCPTAEVRCRAFPRRRGLGEAHLQSNHGIRRLRRF